MEEKRVWRILKPVLLCVLAVGIAMSFLFALERLEDGNDSKSKEQLEKSIRRAIAASYATDGAYPESLDDIVARYGIQIDGDKYDVFYMPVAENLAPDLDIVEREGVGLR